jgi:hypothetical protein
VRSVVGYPELPWRCSGRRYLTTALEKETGNKVAVRSRRNASRKWHNIHQFASFISGLSGCFRSADANAARRSTKIMKARVVWMAGLTNATDIAVGKIPMHFDVDTMARNAVRKLVWPSSAVVAPRR